MEDPVFSNDRWMIRVVIGNPNYFYVDGPFDGIDDNILETFFNWELYGEVIYLFGDYNGLPKALINKIVIKQSSSKQDNSYACFYHIADQLNPTKSIKDCVFTISFQGSLTTHHIRLKAIDAVNKFDSFHFEPTKFWKNCSLEEKGILRQKYLHCLNDSKFVLCPRGAGLNSIRFFETLRMGRIPVLVSDDAKLPLDWLINYNNFVVFVPEDAIFNTRHHVENWCKVHDLETASHQARTTSLQYFEDINIFTQLCKDNVCAVKKH